MVSGLKPSTLISFNCSGITILEFCSRDACVTSSCFSSWALPTKYFSAAWETDWIAWAFIRGGLLEKRFIPAGLGALLLLLPLALTSTTGWQRRLGRRWRRLHWLVYLGAVLAGTHYIWQAKADLRQPLIFAAVILLLLLLRLPRKYRPHNR